MGVKDLWNIISPLSDRRPIFELQGKIIAIDLSGWVVDSQSVTDNVVQQKMYLRNLFFRTAFLLMHEISPVFVLEGTAPNLKHKTLARRNEIRNGPMEKKTNKKGGRSNFNRILKECEEMLKYMGISCVRGHGEAEAMCAYLNAEGLVDGCISQDSDCFLYGAKIVYRNFCTNSQGNRGTSSGSVDEYTIEKIERAFGLGRNKMIALALLCGCDYGDGLNGVGKEAALKLFKVVSEEEILNRVRSWKTDDSLFQKMEADLSNPYICTSCGHQGKMRAHVKSGCLDCGTFTKCNDTYKEKRILISNEISIRKKALLVEDFPNQDLINEFLYRKDPLPSSLDLEWKQPQVPMFVNFMERHLTWETEYAYAKMLPLLTRWQIRHLSKIPDDRRLRLTNLLIPERIKKSRNIKGIASYEIVWKDENGLFEGMTLASIYDKENDEDSPSSTELSTLEPQHLFQRCYSLLVEEFENAKLAKKKKPVKTRRRKIQSANDAPEEKKEEKKKAQRRPRKPKTVETEKNRKIDEFIKNNAPTFEESFEAMTITPKRKKKNNDFTQDSIKRKFDKVAEIKQMDNILNGSLLRMFNELTPEDFPSDVEDANMSYIINKICNQSQTMDISLKNNQSTVNNSIEDLYVPVQYKGNIEEMKSMINLKNKATDLRKSILTKPKKVDSKDESDYLDCTFKRILATRNNAVDCTKKIFSAIKSPNIFAKTKKSKGKFDLLNFTSKRQNSLDSSITLKTEDSNCKLTNIFNISKLKVSDQNNSMDEINIANFSMEQACLSQNLDMDFKDENSISKPRSILNILESKMSVHNNSVDEIGFINSSLERFSLTEKVGIDYENSEHSITKPNNILDVSKFKTSCQNNFPGEMDFINSSLEHMRLVQKPDADIKNFEGNIRTSSNFLDISKFQLPEQNKLFDQFEFSNSTLERLQITQKPENDVKNAENDIQKLVNNYNLEDNSLKKKIVLGRAKLIIPDENECTDESDLFDSTIEYSRDLQSSEVDCKRKEDSFQASSDILNKSKIKFSEENESIDEFDILSSTYVPLSERLKDSMKPEIVRTSTPDFMAVSGKKFSFGIDDLLNDTDL